jgi:hypothetical protein
MPLGEVKPGMRGVGRTVFEDAGIEEFGVEILGILENAGGPDRNIILARLSGEQVAFTGVIDGMSGSPVYVDGRLVGAVSIRIGIFGKLPIAGITPIEEMLAIQGKAPVSSGRLSRLRVLTETLVQASAEGPASDGDIPAVLPPASHHEKNLPQHLRTPLSFSGFETPAFERFSPYFDALGFSSFQGGGPPAGQAASPDPVLPGSMICVQLVSGDANLTASGTVTTADEKILLAFGHPFFKMGPVAWPIFRGRVLTVFPSDLGSFKVTVPLDEIGVLTYDGSAGILCELGREADLLPFYLTLKTGQGNGPGAGPTEAQYKAHQFKLARHHEIVPLLAGLVFFSSLNRAIEGPGEITVDLEGSLGVRGHPEVRINNVFSGRSAEFEAVTHLMQLVMMIGQNAFEEVTFDRIDLTATVSHESRRAAIEEIWTDAREVFPGDTLSLNVAVRPFRGEKKVYSEKIVIPENYPEGTLTLIAGHADAINRAERRLFRGEVVYRDLKQLFKILNDLRQNRQIHVLMLRPEKSAIFKGKFFPSLPPSKYAVMKPGASRSGLNAYNIGIVDSIRIETDHVISGYREVSIKVGKKLGSP